MTEEQKAAFIFSQSIATLVEAFGMMSENLYRLQTEQSIAYGEGNFTALLRTSGIERNDVLSFFQE